MQKRYQYCMSGMFAATDQNHYEINIPSPHTYDFDEFTKAGGYIRLLNPELGDDVCIIEDSDFLDTDKTFADIFPNMEYLKLYYIDNLAYSIDKITEGDK